MSFFPLGQTPGPRNWLSLSNVVVGSPGQLPVSLLHDVIRNPPEPALPLTSGHVQSAPAPPPHPPDPAGVPPSRSQSSWLVAPWSPVDSALTPLAGDQVVDVGPEVPHPMDRHEGVRGVPKEDKPLSRDVPSPHSNAWDPQRHDLAFRFIFAWN